MPQKSFAQLATILSLLVILLASSVIWIFVDDASAPQSLDSQHTTVAELAPPTTIQPTTAAEDVRQVTVNSQNGSASESINTEALTVITRLTGRQWVFGNTSSQPDGFRLVFFNDGGFTRSAVSDYTENRTGIWSYKEIRKSVGLLFMLTKTSSSGPGGSEEVFRISFMANDLLLLGRYLLRPDVVVPVQTDQARSSSVKDIVNEKNFPAYFRLTAQPWIRLGTKDNNFIPDLLTLHGNGTFKGSYRKGECRHDGYWSLERSQIFLELPRNHCDTRGYRDPVVRGHYYVFDNGSLILDQSYRYSASE
jgi:hypothetical protein